MSIPVYMIFPNLRVSGVLSFALNLVRALNADEGPYRGEILILPNEPIAPEHAENFCGAPVTVLPADRLLTSREKLQMLIDHINANDAAIVCPNYYFNVLPILPFLHAGVRTFFALHSDEKVYYDSARLFGSYCDALVGVSSRIVDRLGRLDPVLKAKTSMIQYGVNIADAYRHNSDETMRIVYFGRIVEEQKRVSRMVSIIKRLNETGIDFVWSFVGEGSEIASLQAKLSAEIEAGTVKFYPAMTVEEVQAFAHAQDAYVLTSDYEGTPLALIEAMGCGCIPVVNDIESGIPEMLEDGKTGFIVKQGSTDAYVDRIAELAADREKRSAMSRACYEEAKSRFDTRVMLKKYSALFDQMTRKAKTDDLRAGRLDMSLFQSMVLLVVSDIAFPILKGLDRIAIFGWGMSGQRTYDFLEKHYPGKVQCIVDDHKSGEAAAVPIVTSEAFLNEWEPRIEFLFAGAYQRLNPDLMKRLSIPFLKLADVT